MAGLINPIDWEKYPFVNTGYQYAIDIVEGKIVACKYVIGTCQRFLREYAKEDATYYFSPEKAERYLTAVQRFEHVIGTWATKNIVYSPWQCFIWMNIMGFTMRETGFRRFRLAHVEVARGGAKSTMASQALLYFLALDENIQGNQIATVATKKDQARIVLDAARAMAKKAPRFLLEKGVKVQAHTIVQEESNSVARALSSRDDGLDGLNDILAICDELHAMSREVFDVIYSGMSKRKDSLTLCITTAGFDMDSVGYSQSQYAKKVCLGDVEDDQMFAIVYTLDEEDIKNDKNIFNEAVWIKANPSYGGSVDPVTFQAKAKKAKETPSDLPNFKVKHLNIWLSEANSFFDVNKFKTCAKPEMKLSDFKGQKCRVGVDVASHIDLTSIAILFKKDGLYHFFDKSYIPEATVERVRSTLYDNCIGQGFLIKTPGEAIDQEFIEKEIISLTKEFRVEDCLLDPWNAVNLMQSLEKKRVPVTEFRMNVSNLSEPTKTLDSLIRKGMVRYNGSPLLEWCLGNVVCKKDAADNVFPKKNHERLKIDPIIAMIFALASLLQEEQKGGIYSGDRGLRFL